MLTAPTAVRRGSQTTDGKQAGSDPASASGSHGLRAQLRGMSFDQGEAALAPVQRKGGDEPTEGPGDVGAKGGPVVVDETTVGTPAVKDDQLEEVITHPKDYSPKTVTLARERLARHKGKGYVQGLDPAASDDVGPTPDGPAGEDVSAEPTQGGSGGEPSAASRSANGLTLGAGMTIRAYRRAGKEIAASEAGVPQAGDQVEVVSGNFAITFTFTLDSAYAGWRCYGGLASTIDGREFPRMPGVDVLEAAGLSHDEANVALTRALSATGSEMNAYDGSLASFGHNQVTIGAGRVQGALGPALYDAAGKVRPGMEDLEAQLASVGIAFVPQGRKFGLQVEDQDLGTCAPGEVIAISDLECLHAKGRLALPGGDAVSPGDPDGVLQAELERLTKGGDADNRAGLAIHCDVMRLAMLSAVFSDTRVQIALALGYKDQAIDGMLAMRVADTSDSVVGDFPLSVKVVGALSQICNSKPAAAKKAIKSTWQAVAGQEAPDPSVDMSRIATPSAWSGPAGAVYNQAIVDHLSGKEAPHKRGKEWLRDWYGTAEATLGEGYGDHVYQGSTGEVDYSQVAHLGGSSGAQNGPAKDPKADPKGSSDPTKAKTKTDPKTNTKTKTPPPVKTDVTKSIVKTLPKPAPENGPGGDAASGFTYQEVSLFRGFEQQIWELSGAAMVDWLRKLVESGKSSRTVPPALLGFQFGQFAYERYDLWVRGQRRHQVLDDMMRKYLSKYADGQMPATVIAALRRTIEQLPIGDQKPYFLALQAKSRYASQRDNASVGQETDVGTTANSDNMCNLTTLAMLLEQLGVSNPQAAKYPQFEDYLEWLRMEKHFGARTDPATMAKLANEFGVTRFEKLFSWCSIKRRDWEKIRDAHLAKGSAVLLWVNGKTSGHYVRLQAVSAAGIVVDDPFGLETLGSDNERTHARGDLNAKGKADTKGEDNTWAWHTIEAHTFKGVFALAH